MYHYAGNNPVKYTDPDGRTAKNSDKEKYVIGRLEDDSERSHYMILAPGDFSTANFDGFIYDSSNMGKVSAFEKWNDNVDFTILGDSADGVDFKINGLKSKWTNYSRDLIKCVELV